MIEAALSTFCVIMSSLILFKSTNPIKPRLLVLLSLIGFALIWVSSFTFLVVFSNMILVFFLILVGKLYNRSLNFWHSIYGPFISVMITSIINFIIYFFMSICFKLTLALAVSSLVTLIITILLSKSDKFQSLYYLDLNPLGVSIVVIGVLILFLFMHSVSSNNLILFYLINFLIILLLVYRLAEYHEKKKYREESYEMLVHYSEQLEELNNELSTFKHDYINLLLTLKKSIDSNNQKETQEIFYTAILPSKYIISDTNSNLEKYKHLKIVELKNLILTKELEANQLDIKMNIRVIGDLDRVNIPLIDLIRIVSVLIDNAVQAAHQSKGDKKISVCITKIENEITITVSNSIKGLEIDQTKIFEKKYSTTHDKNRGVGLFSLKRIVNKYPSVNLITEFKEDLIYQSIVIYNQTES